MSTAIAEAPPASTPPKLMLRRNEAAAACGKGISTWDRLTAMGMTPQPTRLGGTLLWNSDELAEWCRRGCPPRQEWASIWKAILARQSR